MGEKQYIDPRWKFIDDIQNWFEEKNKFWLVINILTFSSVLVLQVVLNFASSVNPTVRQGVDFLLIPILALFVLSIFWRSAVQTLLSLVGVLVTYGGIFFFYTVNGTTQLVNTYVASRLGYGIKHITIITITPTSVADRYFIVGILALAFCVAMAIIQFFQTKRPRQPPISNM